MDPSSFSGVGLHPAMASWPFGVVDLLSRIIQVCGEWGPKYICDLFNSHWYW